MDFNRKGIEGEKRGKFDQINVFYMDTNVCVAAARLQATAEHSSSKCIDRVYYTASSSIYWQWIYAPC